MTIRPQWRFLIIAILWMAGFAMPSALRATPAPGTVIRAQAFLNYVDPALFIGRDTPSNIVQAVVLGAPGIQLVRDQTLTRTPGSFFTFAHTLSNTGNIDGAYVVTPALAPGAPFSLLNLALVIDTNRNGVIDTGETRLPFAPHTLSIPPGASVDFILTGQLEPVLPDSVPDLSAATFTFSARETVANLSAANTDILRVSRDSTDAGSLQLNKAVSPSVAPRDTTAVYTITGTNNYSTALQPINITIDGVPRSRVVVRDEIPANLVLEAILDTNGATPLYRLAGAPRHAYVTTPPADLTLVSAVAWAFEQMGPSFSFSVSFRVRVGLNATGQIPNTATASFNRSGLGLDVDSNVALLNVPSEPPAIRYYYDNTFTRVIDSTRLGADLFLQADAGACNTSADTIQFVTIIINNPRNGDVIIIHDVAETGPNTGSFRILPYVRTEDEFLHPVNPSDDILQTRPRDELVAEIVGCGGVTVRTRILIDPAGIVYDSRTNEPVAGATVTLYDASSGLLAPVLGDDLSPAPNPVVTGADGAFRFPLVSPGSYRIDVTPPALYSFPSVIPGGLQPAGRRFVVPSSLGGAFPVNASTGPVFLDLPLDTASGDGLVLEKKASRDTAEIGESVIYTLTLANSSGAPFNGTHIDDRLPLGFRYEPGTATRDGSPAPDPAGGVGPALRFPVGTLADGASVTFTYRVRLTPGAEKGDGVNTARATSLGPPVLLSNLARARVRVELGVFDPRSVIIGTVFVDTDRDTIQDPGEPGVPGVRLVLEDGTYAITDDEGQYSIYGQRAVTHALKLDEATLPPGATLGGEGPRFAGHPGLRFVDLKKHELHKANFTLVDPTPALLAAIEARRAQIDLWRPELETALRTQFNADGSRPLLSDVESREASGVVGTGAGSSSSSGFEQVLPRGTLTAANSSLPPSPVAPVPALDLEALVRDIDDDSPDFIGLKDGDTLPRDLLTVRVKGAREATLALLVNGAPAPESRIGKAITRAEPPLQAAEYVALRLQPGINTLELVQSDLFGNVRARKSITVVAPDSLARLELSFSTLEPKADGRTPVEVSVRAVDAKGVPVTADLPLTLETTLGRWQADDINPREPGLQVNLRDGAATYRLLPPITPGEADLVVSSGTLKADRRLVFLPELRPMIATGVIEGRFMLSDLASNQLLPADPSDAFEEELREQAGIGDDGTGSGRAAFYLKGKVKGDVLLTLAYDSDKRKDDVKLFRDIDPDAYYPVYGDSSTRGYDAQSTGKLYVRLDKGRSYALLGDYSTRANSEVRQLGDYNRAFNGVRLQHENKRLRGGLWASDASTRQVVREIPGNGTSGPYDFTAAAGLINSETVEILVRDRNQTSVILSTRTLARNVDYDFEPFTGRVLLRRPLASVDSNFNPQSLRITYEVETGGDKFWVYGGDVSVKPTERVEVGGSFARDENPIDPYDLQSVNATVQLFEGNILIAEGARSETLADGIGYAGRLDYRHKSEKTEARVFYGETETSFVNPSSQLSSGRVEAGAKVTRDLAPRTQLIGEAVYTADQAGVTDQRQGARLDVAHTLPNQVKLTFGGRASEENITSFSGGPGGDEQLISVRSLRARVDTPLPRAPQATVFGEYEQNILSADQRVVAAGGNYQVNTKTRLYARHEFISTLGSPFELNSSQRNNRTLFGLETEYLRDAYFYNEYRVRSAIDGGQSEASTGLRNDWSVADGLRLNTTFERVTPIEAGSAGSPAVESESTAATLGADYTRPADWKATGRLEGRWGESSDNYLNTLGYARKLNDQWTYLGRTILATQLGEPSGASPAQPDIWQGRVLSGLAWRQTKEDVWNALFRHEYKYERGSLNLGSPDLVRQVHVLATSVNYQPDPKWIFAGHYATKFVQERYDFSPGADYVAHLLAGRVIHEFHRRWDAGINWAVTFSDSFANQQWALGPEIGFIFTKNARIGLGYNIVGFDDRDFDAAATSRGLFLSIRVKFDENLIKWARFDDQEDQP